MTVITQPNVPIITPGIQGTKQPPLDKPMPQVAQLVAPQAQAVQLSALNGVKVLLQGNSGAGKTYSLGTLAEVSPELEVFCLFTENGLETLLGYYSDAKKPIPPNLHWRVFPQTGASLSLLADYARKVNKLEPKVILSNPDPDRAKFNDLEKLYREMCDFPDDKTGLKFNSVDKWGTNRVLALDSLSGLNYIASTLVVGASPFREQRDWGTIQNLIEHFIHLLSNSCKCHIVLTAHTERESDPLTMQPTITVSTPGKALVGKLPKEFSDIIMAIKNGPGDYKWSTATPGATLKNRNLPDSQSINPNFKAIFDTWLSRGGLFRPA